MQAGERTERLAGRSDISLSTAGPLFLPEPVCTANVSWRIRGH